MQNEVFRDADFLSLPVTDTTLKAGAPTRVGELNVVLATDVAQTPTNTPPDFGGYGGGNPVGYASCWLRGAHELEVAGASAAAFTAGVPVYIADDALTLTATDADLYGHVLPSTPVAGETAGTFVVRVRISN